MSAGLRAGTSNDGYLQINGTDVLTALSSGNVGIGTATPGAKLDVTGDIRLSGADPEIEFNASGPRLKSPASNTLTIHTAGGLNTTSNEIVRITSAGLGVGTTSLFAVGASWDILQVGFSGIQGPIAGANGPSLVYNSYFDGTSWVRASANATSAMSFDGGGFKFFVDGSAAAGTFTPTQRLTIDNNGNVGIGITNPSSKLQIQGTVSTINNPFLLIQNDINGAGQSLNSYNFAASFTNTRGNHSYGIVSEFRTNTAGDTDRPSILFRGAQSSLSWQVGQITSGWTTNTTASGITGTAPGNDEFGIGYRSTNNVTALSTWPAAYLSVNTSGHVTIPFQPAFRAVREAPTVVIQSAQRIPYNSKTANGGFDNTNSYDTSTFAFTAPVGGVYFFQASTYTQLNTESMWDIRVNGGFRQRAELRQSAGDDIGDNTIINASCVVKLAANDVVDVYWASNDVDVLATGGYISFSGCKIS